jgi:hypothetical protein
VFDRSLCRLFFWAPHKSDDARHRVAEDAAHFFLRTETGEPVCVEKTLVFA